MARQGRAQVSVPSGELQLLLRVGRLLPLGRVLRMTGSRGAPDGHPAQRFTARTVKRSAAAIDGVTGELVQAKLTSSHEHTRSWVQALPGPVAVTYEAGPTGFDLDRALTIAGIRCEVAAPSTLQPSGNRVKTDAKDAVYLARLLRLDEITAVAIPSVDQEAARDLVRPVKTAAVT